MTVTILQGDALSVLRGMPDESVHCAVTSPPYFGLRDYGVAGQIGLEPTPDAYVAELVAVFREVRRVLRKDGTCWIVIGDSYAGGGNGGGGAYAADRANWRDVPTRSGQRAAINGLKPKDLIGIPWMVAFALRADGWYLRQDIIWSKGNPMPESVRDRCCKSHEYLFLLTKRKTYYFDSEAIAEDANEAVQHVQSRSSDELFQQEQPATRRANGQVQGLPFDHSEEVGPQVQPNGRGESGQGEILLFSEGPSHEGSLPGKLFSQPRAAGALPPSGASARETRAIQGQAGTVRPNREGSSGEISTRQEICPDREGAVYKAQNGDQTQSCDDKPRLHANPIGMAGNQGTVQEPLRVLPENSVTARNGSRDAPVKGGGAHGVECGSGVPDVQRQEGQSRAKRTRRSVWHINTSSFPAAHFATFPPALIEPCIKAGTSQHGVCAACGAPWSRTTDRTSMDPTRVGEWKSTGEKHRNDIDRKGGFASEVTTTGWSPMCSCAAPLIPATVLDPFAGAGTTGLVADRLGRDAILIELNPEYCAMMRRRISGDAPLFVEVAE